MAGVFAIDGARRLTSVRLAYSPHAKSKLREQNLKARGAYFLTIELLSIKQTNIIS
jgi:hypothetical protein